MRQNTFSPSATRTFLLVLVALYFFLPSALAEYLFENNFYIYSPYQHAGNILSALFGFMVAVWLFFLLPARCAREIPLLELLANSKLLRASYYAFLLYLIAAIAYGMHLRAGGAGRFELLEGEDNFLFPGMGLVLLNCAIHSIWSKKMTKLLVVVVLCVLEDTIFNGKIFSFLAVGMIFFRLDYVNLTREAVQRIFVTVSLLGFLMIMLMGISRTYLAGSDLNTDFLPLVYTAGFEFMGVQASVGWAVAYHNNHQPMDLLTFVTTLQDSYLTKVGHGLGASPAAYFAGNFGNWGIPVALVALCLIALIVRLACKDLAWVAVLIVTLNFQHFLRHGFGVFLEKITVEIAYFYAISLLYLTALRVKRVIASRMLPTAAG